MSRPETVTKGRVLELLMYEADTGKFYWKVDHGSARGGDEAGTYNCKRYVRINIDGRRYMAHRLVWLIHTGSFPKNQIDHKNWIMDDNRLENLREVTNSVNKQNMYKARANNKTGFLGVSPNANRTRFISQINIGGQRAYLGTYDSPEKAHAVYLEAKRKHHVGCMI